MAMLTEIENYAERSIKPIADVVDEKGEFPRFLLPELSEMGFLSVMYPEKFGGENLNFINQGLFVEQAGKYCGNLKNLFLVSMAMVGSAILEYGNKAQINHWLPKLAGGEAIGAFALTEPNHGSNSAGIECKFEPVSGGFLISGQKKWITLGGIADFLLVVAKRSGRTGVFIVESDRPKIHRKDIPGLLGNRASHVAEIELNNVFIPTQNLLGPIEAGNSSLVAKILDIGRYHSAWGGVALGNACLEAMITYSRSRTQFGTKIRTNQLVQQLIGNATTNLSAAKALALQAGHLRDRGDLTATNSTTMAKYFASTTVMQIAQDAVQLHGGVGYSSEAPVARYFREAKAFEIIEGTSQILVQLIAKQSILGMR